MTEPDRNTGSDRAFCGPLYALVRRLRMLNDWRTGAEIEQPNPAEVTVDIAEAADLLERMNEALIWHIQVYRVADEAWDRDADLERIYKSLLTPKASADGRG
jgi:hypothetical protein